MGIANKSILPLSLEFLSVWVLHSSFIPLTPLRDQNRISPDNIVFNTKSTRHVIKISKNITEEIISWSNTNFIHTPFRAQPLSCINNWQSITIYLPLFPKIRKWRRSSSTTFFSVIFHVSLMPVLNCSLSGLFNWAISLAFGM